MKRAVLKAAVVACLICGGTTAKAADFIFTFGSDLSDPNVGASAQSGTVTGRIVGLAEDGTSSAQSVFIDLYSPNGSFLPIDVMQWFSPFEFENSFTIENGEIVSAIFQRSNEFGPLERFWINVPIADFGGTNYASFGSNNTASIWNNQGMNGITFTRIDTVVPEPASWALMLLGFGAVGVVVRRRRRLALAA